MEPMAPFRVRRVLLGVVIGTALLALGFYGWVQYRTGQFHHRADALVARYHQAYEQCVAGGGLAPDCATRVVDACRRDAFWVTGQPFAFLPGSSAADAAGRCARAPGG
jgi:hypothetical protein